MVDNRIETTISKENSFLFLSNYKDKINHCYIYFGGFFFFWLQIPFHVGFEFSFIVLNGSQ